ncbi:MAG: hypothetical protein U0822_23595 [Anaerolineae bacterium]
MDIGLLWYDRDPRTPFAAKVALAAERYQERFGLEPNLVLVHPSALSEGAAAPGFEVRANAYVRPHHLMLGYDADAQPTPRVAETPAAPVDDERPRKKRRAA